MLLLQLKKEEKKFILQEGPSPPMQHLASLLEAKKHIAVKNKKVFEGSGLKKRKVIEKNQAVNPKEEERRKKIRMVLKSK